MRALHRTLCPYTLLPLTKLEKDSREHIVLDGLGGPDGFAVVACKKVNNEFGSSVDAAFLNEPLVAMLRTQAGVKGRSGAAVWKMNGETPDGRKVQSVFSKDEVDVHYHKPVTVTETDEGKLYEIFSHHRQSRPELEKIQKNLARKGRAIEEVEIKEVPSPLIRHRLVYNRNILEAGLMKIAYLACFERLGDAFLNDPLNAEWQKAVRVKTVEESKAILIRSNYNPQMPEDVLRIILPELEAHEHGIAIVNLTDDGPKVFVQLFGNPLLTLFSEISRTNDFGMGELEGEVIKIDARSGVITRELWKSKIARLTGENL